MRNKLLSILVALMMASGMLVASSDSAAATASGCSAWRPDLKRGVAYCQYGNFDMFRVRVICWWTDGYQENRWGPWVWAGGAYNSAVICPQYAVKADYEV